MVNHEHFIRRVVDLSRQAASQGKDPFAALLVWDGVEIHASMDRSVELSDPTMHAELLAISTFCREHRIFDLKDCTLYASCEPCIMCSGAIHWARVGQVVFCVSQSSLNKASGGKPKPTSASLINCGRHAVPVLGPLLEDYGLQVFRDYPLEPKAIRHKALFDNKEHGT